MPLNAWKFLLGLQLTTSSGQHIYPVLVPNYPKETSSSHSLHHICVIQSPNLHRCDVFYGKPLGRRQTQKTHTPNPYQKQSPITPPKFNIAPKNGWLEDERFLLGFGNYSGAVPVKLREGIQQQKPTIPTPCPQEKRVGGLLVIVQIRTQRTQLDHRPIAFSGDRRQNGIDALRFGV